MPQPHPTNFRLILVLEANANGAFTFAPAY